MKKIIDFIKKNKGFSLIEVIIAMVVIVIASLSVVQLHHFMSSQSTRVRKKAFATQKAIQMMEELRSLVYGAEKTDINVLDQYDNGTQYPYELTIDTTVPSPDAPLSGNIPNRGSWYFSRNIEIRRMADDEFARKVFVRVFKNSESTPGTPEETLAEVSSILRTITSEYVPTQVYDLYLVAIENVPGWWVSLALLRPMMENIIEDLRMRNPGLEFRVHWITRLSYGRDKEYVPYANDATTTENTTIPYVYFYPGSTNSGYYYATNVLKSKFNIDGTVVNSESYALCDQYNHAVRYPQEIAEFNEEVASAESSGISAPEISLRMLMEYINSNSTTYKNIILLNLHGEMVPLPPMRNYSDAAKDPINYPYARVVTHPQRLQYSTGSEFKLRVYPYTTNLQYGATSQYYNNSDFTGLALTRYDPSVDFDWAAGSPDGAVDAETFSVRWTGKIRPRFSENYNFYTETDDGVQLWVDGNQIINDPNIHVVTTNMGVIPLTAGQEYHVRMDYFEDTGDAVAKLYWESASQPKEIVQFAEIPITTVYIPNKNITPGTVEKIHGDEYHSYLKESVPQGTTMYQVTHPNGGDTLITLYKTPLRHGLNSSNQGIPSTDRLWGMEYIPCPLDAEFTRELTNTASNRPKNTARWIITFPAATLTSPTTVYIQTRIGNDYFSIGVDTPACNISETYTWVGTTPPVTELCQFMGDARHCPYFDVKSDARYNRYFRNVDDTDYPGFTLARDGWFDSNGWGADYIPIDLPRYFMLIREGLLTSQGIWSTMNGVSFFYHGLGGEIGNDKSPWTSGIPIRQLPWSTGSADSSVGVDEILDEGHSTIRGTHFIARKDNSWYAKYWLGELYPDEVYDTYWRPAGNLPTGTSSSLFYRARYNTSFSAPSDFYTSTRGRCISYRGSASFINGSTTRAFRHGSNDSATGNITNLGTAMSSTFNLPLLSQVLATRPYALASSTDYPPEWSQSPYSSIRTTLSTPNITPTHGNRIFYTSSMGGSYIANSVVKVVRSNDTCYMVYSGVATQGEFGTAQIGKLVIVTCLRTFLDSGLYATAQDRITQLPLVDMTSPTSVDEFPDPGDPDYITINWDHSWVKWDESTYTEEYPANYPTGYGGEPSILYTVKYSDDNERTWKHCIDGSSTDFGVLDTGYSTTLKQYKWDISALPGGTYVILVECYRQNTPLHFSYEKLRTYIRR
ncbi:MAG: prepilin-type N-terminal cleavage/methylation domain-containing protein [Endomicrobiales bacterium]|nr:prepilin-type N-terminal cleavage/methylation domain-containing protein [Endomicrobiales bacterium]